MKTYSDSQFQVFTSHTHHADVYIYCGCWCRYLAIFVYSDHIMPICYVYLTISLKANIPPCGQEEPQRTSVCQGSGCRSKTCTQQGDAYSQRRRSTWVPSGGNERLLRMVELLNPEITICKLTFCFCFDGHSRHACQLSLFEAPIHGQNASNVVILCTCSEGGLNENWKAALFHFKLERKASLRPNPIKSISNQSSSIPFSEISLKAK